MTQLTEQKIEVRKEVYLVGAIVAVILSLLVNAVWIYLWYWSASVLGEVRGYGTYPLLVAGGVLVMLAYTWFMNRFKSGLGLNVKEMGVIIAMLFPVATLSGAFINYYMFGLGPNFMIDIQKGTRFLATQIPAFMSPAGVWTDPVYQNYLYGGALDWAAWLPSIGFWSIIMLTQVLSLVFLGYIWRQDFIDIESLPFPVSRFITETTLAGTTYPKPKIFTKEYRGFLVGLLLGIACFIHIVIGLVIPGFTGIAGERGALENTVPWGVTAGLDFTIDAGKFLPGLSVVLNLSPTWLVLMYMAPLNILLSFVVFGLFLWEMGIFLVPAGLLNWNPTFNYGSLRGALQGATPGPLLSTFGQGTMIGIVLGLVIFRYRYIIDTIKLALGMKADLKEDREPLRYRWLWIGYIVSSLINFGLWLVAGVPPFTALVTYVFLGLILPLGIARMMGYFDWLTGGYYYGMTPTLAYLVGATPPTGTPGLVSAQAVQAWGSFTTGEYYSATQQTMIMNSIGTKFDNRPREIFFGNIIGVLAAIIVGVPVMLWSAYNIGALFSTTFRGFVSSRVWIGLDWGDVGYAPPTMVTSGIWQASFIAGIIVPVVFMFLRTSFLWFPLEPAILPIILAGGLTIPVFPAIIAYILKWGTFKIGGANLYEEWGIRIAVGFLVGAFLMVFIQVLCLTIGAIT